ncbi:MAG TPA: SDR family oxidoreductase [Nitrososphaeraceae archaeon]|jgi:NAD(P)-dependent dehydrogenase (short-subunit alcohol dehydrogenase family)|nr:SDR family oxidoreductase [Nitrososphaeraceae archaeon]
MQVEKVALVTGSSSGIGFETALLLSKSGFHTYASMRNLEKSKNITEIVNTENLPLRVIQLDVNDDISVKNAINKIIAENGRIDVLINNAGYGLFSPIEDITLDQVKEQFETNFFGVVRLVKEVLPVMRKQRNGIIVNVSSGAGRVAIPVSSAYVATKFALEELSESMRYELKEFGINIIIIEPGVIRTNFVENMKTAGTRSRSESPYADLIGRTLKGFGGLMDNSSPPKLVAEAILNAITSKEPEIRYVVGDDAKSIMKVRKSTSDKEFENWMYESVLQEKGFVRTNTVEVG